MSVDALAESEWLRSVADVTVVVRGGSVVGPEGLRRADVALAGTVVVAVAETIEAPTGALVLDARGCLVGPGLVDLHTHLRQPGREEAETVETGARAAALGGYTAVVAMPNTEPAIDSAGVARDVLALGRGAWPRWRCPVPSRSGGPARPWPRWASWPRWGCASSPTTAPACRTARLMRRALDYAKGLGVTLAQHCEDELPGRRGRHARGVLVEPAGSARDSGGGRGVDGGPRHPAGAAHRCAGALPAPLDGRVGGAGPPGQGRGAAGHGRGGARTTCC